MEESDDSRHGPHVYDEGAVEFESNEEYSDDEDNTSNERAHQSDTGEEDGTVRSTLTRTRLRQQIFTRLLEQLRQREAVDDPEFDDDWEDWEDQMRPLEADILENIESADFDEAERLLLLLMEARGNPPRRINADDLRMRKECSVCREVVKVDERPCCSLPICQECMRKYVETQLMEVGVVRIGCPNPACDALVFHEEIRELLRSAPELRDRYDRWMLELNADPRRKTCPRCRRLTELPADRPRDRRAAKYGLMVDCPDCRFVWCFHCQAPWHQGLTCAKNRAGDELLKKWARQRTLSDYNAQRCPKCKV